MRGRAVVLVFLALALVACGGSRRPESVVVGLALTEAHARGALIAADELNAAGGIANRRLEFEGLDWEILNHPDPEEVARHARQFADRAELVAVLGPDDSASALLAASTLSSRGVPQLLLTATHPAIVKDYARTYRLCASDLLQGPALAEHAWRWGKRRAVIVHVNDDYGRGLAQSFSARFRLLGGEIVASVLHHNLLEDRDRSLLRSAFTRLAEGPPPDLFVLFQRVEAAQHTIAEIRRFGFEADLLAGDSVGDPSFAGRFDGPGDGMRFVRLAALDESLPAARAFAAEYRRRHRSEPGPGEILAYDAVHLLAEALAGQRPSRDGLNDWLQAAAESGRPLDGAGGVWRLRPDREAERPLLLLEMSAGRGRVLGELQLHGAFGNGS